MSSETYAIRVEDVSKCFHTYDKPIDRLKRSVVPRLQQWVGDAPTSYGKEFWALRNISFEVKRGETVGIVGRNGSGKSTLLQIICGTLTPTSGTVQTHGRVAALLELGSGFNPEFTGRENVFLNGALLGLTREEIDARFDAIAAFADIGEFIEQPVKHYSSGMAVRLAFAVQAQVDPDILIVDEALSVGDARFQAKCFERLRQLKENGTSILLVTHASEQVVTHCDRAVLLDRSRVEMLGKPRPIINRYLDLLFGREKQATPPPEDKTAPLKQAEGVPVMNVEEGDHFLTRPGYNPHEYRWGDGSATLLDYHLRSGGRDFPAQVTSGETIELWLRFRFNRRVINPILGLTLKTKEGVTLYGTNSQLQSCGAIAKLGEADSTAKAKLTFNACLGSGDYFISLGLASQVGDSIVPHDRRYDVIHLCVAPTPQMLGLVDLAGAINVESVS
ncbi:ABC transporter ATP-binding protein [Pseudomonas sp. Marseille-Q5115]|uniref:ABC transporter ATP-binding protein n=1 Tax=Pseudomonas sp. Marseille-Q5115 TaxID=2866593 RepID=UPI001CE4160A|nr:ABC transporter ATP-binding protein [Pseudomonas sp. Marseille-Q5115]